MRVEDDYGATVSARTTGEDVVRASVEAMILGINKLLLKRHLMMKSSGAEEMRVS